MSLCLTQSSVLTTHHFCPGSLIRGLLSPSIKEQRRMKICSACHFLCIRRVCWSGRPFPQHRQQWISLNPSLAIRTAGCLTGCGREAFEARDIKILQAFRPRPWSWYYSCYGYAKRLRPGFFLQTKQSQGLLITWTPEDGQQKAWGKAFIFRSPF